MARELLPSPVDAQTGLPLPILPVEAPSSQMAHLWEDYHHHWFTRRDPRLRGAGGLSLRYSYGQELPRWQHDVYHARFSGPPLPDKDNGDEQFRLAVLGCAGLIGPYAVDVTADNWQEPVRMTADQYTYVADPRRLHIETYGPKRARSVRIHLGKFFAAHAIEQEGLAYVTPRAIKQFLSTKDPARKRELGNLLLGESIELAVAPLKPVKKAFAEAYDRPDIHGWDLGREVRKFFLRRRFGDYYGTLSQRLLASEVVWG